MEKIATSHVFACGVCRQPLALLDSNAQLSAALSAHWKASPPCADDTGLEVASTIVYSGFAAATLLDAARLFESR